MCHNDQSVFIVVIIIIIIIFIIIIIIIININYSIIRLVIIYSEYIKTIKE